jgi:hypothetical protein
MCGPDAYQTKAPTLTSDRACANLTPCTASQFELIKPTAFSDRVCKSITACDFDTQWQFRAATTTSDTVCDSIRDCGPDEITIANATETSDTKCLPFKRLRFYFNTLYSKFEDDLELFTDTMYADLTNVAGFSNDSLVDIMVRPIPPESLNSRRRANADDIIEVEVLVNDLDASLVVPSIIDAILSGNVTFDGVQARLCELDRYFNLQQGLCLFDRPCPEGSFESQPSTQTSARVCTADSPASSSSSGLSGGMSALVAIIIIAVLVVVVIVLVRRNRKITQERERDLKAMREIATNISDTAGPAAVSADSEYDNPMFSKDEEAIMYNPLFEEQVTIPGDDAGYMDLPEPEEETGYLDVMEASSQSMARARTENARAMEGAHSPGSYSLNVNDTAVLLTLRNMSGDLEHHTLTCAPSSGLWFCDNVQIGNGIEKLADVMEYFYGQTGDILTCVAKRSDKYDAEFFAEADRAAKRGVNRGVSNPAYGDAQPTSVAYSGFEDLYDTPTFYED